MASRTYSSSKSQPIASSSKLQGYDKASTYTPSTSPGESCRSVSSYRSSPSKGAARLPAGHWLLAHERHADCPEDLEVLDIFLRLAKVPDHACSPDLAKLMLKTLQFLHACDYPMEDICCYLAHAAAYFVDAFAVYGQDMDLSEIANVLVLQIFLAHTHVQDEACPLKVWHKHLFKKYCPLSTLNKAVMELMAMRKYSLRIADSDLEQSLAQLKQVIRWQPLREASGLEAFSDMISNAARSLFPEQVFGI